MRRPAEAARSSVSAELRSLLAADLPRNPFPTQRMTLFVLRAGQALHGRPGPVAFLLRRVVAVARALWIEGIIGAEIPSMVTIGPGLRLPHAGRGVMIHPSVTIGAGCTLYHQTALGVRDGGDGPQIGDDVEIGAGAKILGAVRVAAGTRVGANAVLVTDTEPGGTYVGMPARRIAGRRDKARRVAQRSEQAQG